MAANDIALATRRLFGPLRDMVVFAPLLVAGWIYRRQPETHKRIMLVATNVLLVAAVGRMRFLGEWLGGPPPVWLILLMVSPLHTTQPWLDFTTWLATFYR